MERHIIIQNTIYNTISLQWTKMLVMYPCCNLPCVYLNDVLRQLKDYGSMIGSHSHHSKQRNNEECGFLA